MYVCFNWNNSCIQPLLEGVSESVLVCERVRQVQKAYNNSLFPLKSIRNLLNTRELERITLLQITVRPRGNAPNYPFKYLADILSALISTNAAEFILKQVLQIEFQFKLSSQWFFFLFCSGCFQFFHFSLIILSITLN